MQPDLSPEDRAAIAADRFPLSARVTRMRAILNKLDPPAPRPPAPFPPVKPQRQPSHFLRKQARR